MSTRAMIDAVNRDTINLETAIFLQRDGDLPDRHTHRDPVLHPPAGTGKNLEGDDWMKDDWMKRRQRVKWLMLLAVTLVAIGVRADVAIPSPYVLPHKEWMTEMNPSVLPWFISPCLALVIFLVVLVLSIRQRRPSYLLWLAWCAPLPFFVPITYERYDVLVYSVLGLLAASWLVPVIFYFRNRKFAQALGCLIVAPFAFALFWYWVGEVSYLKSFSANFKDISVAYYGGVVETREGESYEEYLKRANRIIHHHCKRCDKPMKDYWRDYWLCPDCDKDKMTCQKCGAQKEQERLGLHWQDGFKWLCPNCDKERREEIKRQVEEMRNGK